LVRVASGIWQEFGKGLYLIPVELVLKSARITVDFPDDHPLRFGFDTGAKWDSQIPQELSASVLTHK
jgi:hypothetical protein